jgi:hypothetical protein
MSFINSVCLIFKGRFFFIHSNSNEHWDIHKYLYNKEVNVNYGISDWTVATNSNTRTLNSKSKNEFLT